ncbi:FAD-containing subunit of NADH dehydrogenase [Ustulina deusta]|nr:FAD-containing subunit of NADH dehydrogenase [Ustulina deusta]KAI3330004.1 FAD-containing subunit of NADH dehydrogenase [Ustulina deusta]
MPQRIIIVGSGFAGFWSALSARRLISLNVEKGVPKAAEIEVSVIAPDANLVMRPRLYEPNPANMSAPVDDVYRACGVRFVYGIVDTIRTANHEIEMVDRAGVRSTVPYDKLILAAGSRVVQPAIPGLGNYAFSVDQLEDAVKLDRHLQSLASKPPSKARNTVVVCGGGFTGIEVAAELPARLRAILGDEADVRVVTVERSQDIGPDLGSGPRPHILKALEDLKVESKLGTSVIGFDAEGVTLSSGERIETLTAVWTAGVAATPLTKQVSNKRDNFERLHVDQDLRVPSAKDVFAAGDAASAAADDSGHYAKMSCQHAGPLGRIAGHNAAAELLGIATVAYSQPVYRVCLDLGAAGAVICNDWEVNVQYHGHDAKPVKQFINTRLIYPPNAIAAEAFAAASPTFDGSDPAANYPSLDGFLGESGYKC